MIRVEMPYRDPIKACRLRPLTGKPPCCYEATINENTSPTDFHQTASLLDTARTD